MVQMLTLRCCRLLHSSRTLFRAIHDSIFSTIIEQAPFAIEDLMKELKAAADSDSGQESEEEPGQTDKPEQKAGGAKKQLQMNGGFAGGSSGCLRVKFILN